jgi:folylpolyglutamate synthase
VYSELWKKFDPQAKVLKHSTIEGALMLAKRIGDQEGGVQALVTGSLHMVGGALNILRP